MSFPDDRTEDRGDYVVFGRRLRSSLDFPGLPEAEGGGPPDWTLSVEAGPRPPASGPAVGRDDVEAGIEVRLYRDGEGMRLVFDDTGDFRISSDGARIRWSAPEDVSAEAVRMDVLGRVLPLALHRQGLLVLHASAVLGPSGAIAFLGPKGAGKSTVALALHRRGAAVLADDALAVDPDASPVGAWPGVPDLRLRPDIASAAGLDDDGGTPTSAGGRRVLRPARPPARTSIPLAAVYLLDPPPPDVEEPGLRSEPVTGARAAAALVGSAKVGPLLGREGAPGLLARASAVARGTSVRALRVPRGLDRLSRAVGELLEGDPAAPVAGTGT